MLNRVNNQHIQTNSISFKSVLMHNKNAKAVGQLRYKTVEKIHYTQTATKTILAKIGENFLPEKFQKVLKEQNINIRKGIEILLASGALITLFSKKNKEGNDNLEVKIVDEKNSQEDIYIFDTKYRFFNKIIIIIQIKNKIKILKSVIFLNIYSITSA